jgi:hypothetical protein
MTDRSFANGNGECQAGPGMVPLHLRRQPELAIAREFSYSSWTVQP